MLIFFFTAVLLSLFCYSMMVKNLHYFLQGFQQKCLQQFSEIQLPQQTRWTDLFSKQFILLAARAKFIVLSSAGSVSVMKILEQLNQIPFARRKLVLLDCLNGIHFVYIFLLLLGLGQMNPLFLLFGSLFLYFILKKEKIRQFLMVLIYLSLFLMLTYEYALKFSQSLQMFFVENPAWMFVASNNLQAMLFLMAVAIVIGMFMDVDYWSVVLGYLLVLTGIISVSSALAILAGEILSRDIRYHLIRKKYQMNYFSSKTPRVGFAQILNVPLVWQALAVICALIFATDFSALNPLQMELSAMNQMKTNLYLLSSVVLMMTYWVIHMVYGHFAASE